MSRWLVNRVGPAEKLAHALYRVYGYNAEVALKWLLETGRVPSVATNTGRRSSSAAKGAAGSAGSGRPR